MALQLYRHRRSHHSGKKRRFHKKRHITPTHGVFKTLNAPWPDEFTVKLEYQLAEPDEKVSVAKLLLQYRGNGPFDPEVASGGGQPRGYDQWTTKYQYQFTAASSFEATLSSITPQAAIVAAMWPAEAGTATTGTPYADGERAYARFIQYENNSSGPRTMKSFMSTKKMFGSKSPRIDEPDYASGVGALPATQWYWHISAQNLDLTNELYISTTVKLTYWITFYDRKDPLDALDDDSKEEVKKPDPHPIKSGHIMHRRDPDTGRMMHIDLLTGKDLTELADPPKKKLPSKK